MGAASFTHLNSAALKFRTLGQLIWTKLNLDINLFVLITSYKAFAVYKESS